MRRFAPATVVAALLLLSTQGAMALGLGRVTTLSHLGGPLEFSVGLSAEAGDALSPDCISADVYAGETRVPPEMVRIRVNRRADGVPASLRVVTGTRIDEPVASVQLTLDCGARIARQYTVFIDPPLLDMAQSDAPAETLAAAPAEPPARRATAPSSRRSARATARDPGQVQAGGTGRTSSAARQRRAERAAAARAARAAARAEARSEPGSRLRLESAAPTAAASPLRDRRTGAAGGAAGASAPASAAAAAAPVVANPALQALRAASAPPSSASGAADAASAVAGAGSAAGLGGLIGELAARAEADALAQQAEQLRALEQRLTRLSTQNQSMQKTVAELQARLAEAEANRYANPLVYGLVALLVLLLAAVVALLWRQRQLQQQQSDWLKAAAAETGGERPAPEVRSIVRPGTPAPAPVARNAAAAAAAAGLGGAETVSGVRARSAAGAATPPAEAPAPAPAAEPAVDAAAAGAALAAAGAAAAAPRSPHESTSIHDPRREVTVEELIDLEQQADFFVVLGQDDAAIDLLMGHVQGTGGASPLPYLKLLEIHHRRDDRVAYDRIRERFNRRFGAYAPEWEDHSGHDRSLEDYPAVVARLQDLWPRPAEAMDALAGLLFQRDPGGETFDLGAYGELLFLYSLARERLESEPPPEGVDLLLPLDDGPSSPASGPGAAGGAALGAAGAVAAGAALAADPGRLAALDAGLSLAPQDDLPTLPMLPDAPPAAAQPASPGFTLGDDLLDLNISDEPAEPKGPLSKY